MRDDEPAASSVTAAAVVDSPVGEVTRRAARTVAASAIAEVIGKVGTFAFVLVGARSLTTDEFGAFSFALAAATLLAALPQWGFDTIVIRDASREPSRLGVLLAETWILRLALSVPVMLGAALFGALTRPDIESEIAFVLVVGASLLDTFVLTGRAAATSRQRYSGVAIVHVVQRVSAAVIGAAALALGLELTGFSAAYLAGSAIGILGVTIAVRRLGVRVDFRHVTRAGMSRLLREASPLGLDLLLAMAVLRLDAILLGAFRGDDEVATYALATRVVETVLFLAWAVQHGVFPAMSAADVVWRVRLAVERGMSLLAAAYVPFFVVMLLRGGEVIGLLFGSRYESASTATAAWLAAAPLVIALGNLLTFGLVARHSARQVLGGTVIALAVNIALNLALIPSLGAEGAAIATTAAYAVECVVLMAFAKRAFGIPRLGLALAPATLAGGLMAATMLTVPGGLGGELAAGTAAFLLMWLVLTRWLAPENLAVVGTFVRRRRPPEDWELLRVRRPRPASALLARAGQLVIPAAAAVAGVLVGLIGMHAGPPAMVVLPALGLAAAACFSRPVLAIVGVLVSLPLALDELPFGGLQVIDMAMVGAVALVVLAVLAARSSQSLRLPAFAWGTGLCLMAALAIPGAVDTGRATTRVITLVAGLLLAVATVAASRRLADIRLLIGTFLSVGVVMTLLAFQDLNGLQAESGGLVVRDRPSGVFGDPNELGSFAVLLLLTALGTLLARSSPRMRVLASIVAALSVGALVLSLSRGAWIGAGFGLVGLMVLLPSARRTLLGILAAGAVVGLAIGAFRAGSPEVAVVRERFGAITSSLDSPYDDRPQIWAEARREIRERPWFGWGPANFELSSRARDPSRAGSAPSTRTTCCSRSVRRRDSPPSRS